MTPGKGSWTKKQKNLAVPVYLPHTASAGKDLRTQVPHTAEKDPTILLGSGAACAIALPLTTDAQLAHRSLSGFFLLKMSGTGLC